MKNKILLLLGIGLILSACGRETEETGAIKIQITDIPTEEVSAIASQPVTPDSSAKSADALLDLFLEGEISANYAEGDGDAFFITDLCFDEEDALSYSIGDRVDLDNDGENELIINGAYGGMYLDGRDGQVSVLAQGDGTAATLSYTRFDGQTWIVHSDTTHGGRIMYDFTLYDGLGQIVDAFNLDKEFWNTPDEPDGPDTVYTYRGKQITKAEYDTLKAKIFESANE